MNLPVYEYDCDYILIGNGNPPPIEIDPPVTFDKMYSLMISLHYIFLYPVYDDFGRLDNLVFVEGLCSDCRLTGTPNKPDFWIDLE